MEKVNNSSLDRDFEDVEKWPEQVQVETVNDTETFIVDPKAEKRCLASLLLRFSLV